MAERGGEGFAGDEGAGGLCGEGKRRGQEACPTVELSFEFRIREE